MSQPIRVSHGVWRCPDQVADLADRCAALLSAAPPTAVVAGLAAAQLHRFWLPESLPLRPELILRRDPRPPSGQPRSRRAELRGRRRTIEADEWVVLDGLPVTSPSRTWVDLAEQLTLPDLVAAGDSILRGCATAAQLDSSVRRAVHRRGVIRARTALTMLDGRSRSRPESHLRVAIVSAGLPKPAVNESIYSRRGEWLAEPDLHFEAARLALEYNGAVHADPGQMRRDITRDLDVRTRGGWLTLTFGPAEVFQRPDHVASMVRQALAERMPHLITG